MNALKLLPALAAAALLGACEARIGKDEAPAAETAQGPAEGKAEAGSLSIDVPGFDMKIDIPEGIAREVQLDSDSSILYPGSQLSGMHIAAGAGNGAANRGGVELRFTSPDAPAMIARWYRDPARAAEFSIVSAAREGDTLVIAGAETQGGDPFTLRISPRAGGGSEASLTLRDRG